MFVPLSTRCVVITGPNTGGKTAAMKAVGLASLMARAGLFIPAEIANLPWFDDVLVDIGDLQDLMQSLSTFSARLAKQRAVLRACTPRALVLMDEVGTGTSPAVERCLRQVARDIRDGKDATRSVFPYATQARFSDGARAFTGAEKFERSACEMKRIFEGQGGFKNTVESIEVVPGGSEAKIVWRIRSTDGKTEVKVETTLDLSLIHI